MFPYELNVVALPLSTNFRGVSFREVALFEGPAGWSEFSPFIEYDSRESSIWLKAALEGAMTAAPTKLREGIEINATLPNTEVENLKDLLSKFPGCKTVKIKINDFKKDRELLIEVLRLIPDAYFRLDVNGQWVYEEAVENIINYEKEFDGKIDYFEQPCLKIKDLIELRKNTESKIAVDESIRKHLNQDLSILKKFADIAVIKWAPSGGISAALELIEKIDLPVVISSALESSIGISHGLSLAQSTPNLYGACGLGTAALFKSDITSNPVIVANGQIKNKKIVPDLIDEFKVKPDRQIWWHNRINQIYQEGLI
jgi:O-succinylbenzoate synthase